MDKEEILSYLESLRLPENAEHTKADFNLKPVNKCVIEVIDEPESHLHVKTTDFIMDKLDGDVIAKGSEYAFSDKTGLPCFTNKQMGIFLRAIAEITEAPNPPAKTTLGEVVEKIAGYKATTVNQNMKGATSESDKEIVAKAIESKLPNLAAKVRKL